MIFGGRGGVFRFRTSANGCIAAHAAVCVHR